MKSKLYGIFMERAYYSNSLSGFVAHSIDEVHGALSARHPFSQDERQRNAWRDQIAILQQVVDCFPDGRIYFEFEIPRIGKRADNILIIADTIFVLEFKVGEVRYTKDAIDQVLGYALDLKHFHEGSHHVQIVPIVVATAADEMPFKLHFPSDLVADPVLANSHSLKSAIERCLLGGSQQAIDYLVWERSIYKPTPTIMELAQALYKGHRVEEITRHDAGAINLSKTSDRINQIIDFSKTNDRKSICFITGVPGAGKTLAGLNIASQRSVAGTEEHAVFLSGNGPLVDVLREALARDEMSSNAGRAEKVKRADVERKVAQFIQNIHHFRDDCLKTDKAPVEHVVIFDEAQRAWTLEQTAAFMKQKKGVQEFEQSEPDFLISVMDRHTEWCTVICLVGGGQEINKGEAGIQAWIEALKEHYSDWDVYYSSSILSSELYVNKPEVVSWLKAKGREEELLHLSISMRSYRSEKVSDFVHALLSLDRDGAARILKEVKDQYPILVTRSIGQAKRWLREKVRGSHRAGIVVSSGAKRLRPCGIDTENGVRSNSGRDMISNWFLNGRSDVRSSSFLEVPATQFAIQGLELDWICVAWGEDFYFDGRQWCYQNFTGTSWKNVHSEEAQKYLLNAYRVLLTRARQGVVVYIPQGDVDDETRLIQFYDGTFEYFRSIGVEEI